MIGAGSVVTKNVNPYTLAYGNPAVFVSWVCVCTQKIPKFSDSHEGLWVVKMCEAADKLVGIGTEVSFGV